jgi:hypothetical protein
MIRLDIYKGILNGFSHKVSHEVQVEASSPLRGQEHEVHVFVVVHCFRLLESRPLKPPLLKLATTLPAGKPAQRWFTVATTIATVGGASTPMDDVVVTIKLVV